MKTNPKQYLISTYPDITDFFESVEIPDNLKAKSDSVPQAILRVVIGQMLSTHAARAIHERVLDKAMRRNIEEPWMLDADSLRECGLSGNKCRTITGFRDLYLKNRVEIDQWRSLNSENLQKSVRKNWGMSDWTAGILGIFYFGHDDIFPAGDGSLRRALTCLSEKYPGVVIDPSKSSPYRSYLALALWSGLDNDVL